MKDRDLEFRKVVALSEHVHADDAIKLSVLQLALRFLYLLLGLSARDSLNAKTRRDVGRSEALGIHHALGTGQDAVLQAKRLVTAENLDRASHKGSISRFRQSIRSYDDRDEADLAKGTLFNRSS
jgi:hypothetical protein